MKEKDGNQNGAYDLTFRKRIKTPRDISFGEIKNTIGCLFFLL